MGFQRVAKIEDLWSGEMMGLGQRRIPRENHRGRYRVSGSCPKLHHLRDGSPLQRCPQSPGRGVRGRVVFLKCPETLAMSLGLIAAAYGLAPLRTAARLALSWFGLWRNWLLFYFCCRAFGVLTTEAARKLAAIIRVNVRVVLTARDRHNVWRRCRSRRAVADDDEHRN